MRRRTERSCGAKTLAATAGTLALLVASAYAAPAVGAEPEVVAPVPHEQPYEVFTGTVDEFYEVPDPLPPGEPGDLIRVQDVDETPDEVTVRVMYHSRDARDRDRAVTGMITYPTGPAPDGGWPVVSWAHGGVSMASQCAPSRAGMAPPAFGVDGVRVASDYIGLGPVGEISPVLSKPSVGNSVIDAVRAARQLAQSGAGPRWLAVGHSAGGHGALAAHELAGTHAPELDHVATVAFAPASDLGRTFGAVDEIVTSVVGAATLYGAPSEHPEIDPDDYAGVALAELGDLIRTTCQAEFELAVATVKASEGDDFWQNDPLVTEPARSLLLANEVGDTAADAPVLLSSGTDDPIVVIDRVLSLFGRMCDAGQVTDLRVVDGADHNNVIAMTPGVDRWIADRLDGEPADDSCTTDGGLRPRPPGTDGDGDAGTAVPSARPARAMSGQPSLTG